MRRLPPIFYFLALLATSLTVKFMPLLVTPRTVTNKFPVVAPVGTVVTMLVAVRFSLVTRATVAECYRTSSLRRAEVASTDGYRHSYCYRFVWPPA